MLIVIRSFRFVRNESAAAAVEFSLILPFVILLLFGGIDIAQGVSANRKVGQAAATLSDLISQEATLTASKIANVFTAGSATLVPFDTSSLEVMVANVVVDGNGNAQVDWSRGYNRAALTKGAPYTGIASLPAQYRLPNTSFIVAEVGYGYRPVTGFAVTGTLDMRHTSYALPRSASIRTGVPCPDCS